MGTAKYGLQTETVFIILRATQGLCVKMLYVRNVNPLLVALEGAAAFKFLFKEYKSFVTKRVALELEIHWFSLLNSGFLI